MASSHEIQQGIQSPEIGQPKVPLAQLQEQAAAKRSGMTIPSEESAKIDLPEGLRQASKNGHTLLIDLAGHVFIAPKINRPNK